MRKTKIYKSRRGAKTARRTKKEPKISYGLKHYIKKAIARSEETKFLQPLTVSNLLIAPYDGTSQLCTVINLTTGLQCAQGTGQGDRIGDEINITSLMFRGFVNYANGGSGAQNLPIFIKMVVGRLKSGYAQPTNFSNLFQNGSSTTNPTNLPIDIIRNFNKDSWIIYTQKVFKLGFADPAAASGNNDFSQCKMFKMSLAKHIHRLKYSDAGTNPTNAGLYVWFLMCNANGNAMTAATAPNPEIHYTFEVAYKDS